MSLNASPNPIGRISCAGKVKSDKQMKLNIVQNVLLHAWRRYTSIRIKELTQNVMLFEFEEQQDYDDVMDCCPWIIQGHCLSLKIWSEELRIKDVNLLETQFWVQIHGLELEKLNDSNVRLIVQSLGYVIQVDQTLRPEGL